MRSATTVRRHADAIEQDVSGARAVLAALEKQGISLKEITDQLVTDGVQQFADAFDKLFGAIARSRHALIDGKRAGLEIAPGFPEMKTAYENELEVWRKNGLIRRLWAGDKSLWTGADEDKWLGWLHVIDHELADVGLLQDFAADVKRRNFTDVVLLGMGGSSLGPGSVERDVRPADRLAAFSHAGQHRSRADQSD